MKEFIFEVTIDDKNKRLDAYLSSQFNDISREGIQKLMDGENVRVNNKVIKKPALKLKGTEVIHLQVPEKEKPTLEKENVPLEILYEDEHIAVINKPYNMSVHPAQDIVSGTLVNALLYHFESLSDISEDTTRPGIVHRLDKNTTGAIIIAKTNHAHLKLVDMFKDKTITKTYVAICKGNFKDKEGRLENLIGRDTRDRKKMAVVKINGKPAISNYNVIDEVQDFSLVKVGIETGRTHQIRVHMKSLNHPILGDEVYGSPSPLASRQQLHAYSLVFNHPITNELIEITAPLFEDFKNLLTKLKLDFSKINNNEEGI